MMIAQRITINSFGMALRLLREERGMSYREVAERVGCSRSDIKAWEDGTSYPVGVHLARLHKMCFHRLKHFLHLIPSHFRTEEITAERLSVEPAPVIKEPERDIEEPLPAPRSFGEALKRARVHEGLSQEELGDMLGVVGQAVSEWETDGNTPVREHYEKLVDLFPALKDGPTPDYRDIPKPDGGRGQTRDHVTLRGADTQPPIPSASAPTPDSKPPPWPLKPTPSSITALVGSPQKALTPFEKAGAEYARALHNAKLASARLDAAEKALREAQAGIEDANQAVKIAHDRLLEVVATTMPPHASR
jgi:transcriptional regulator with XRE-family HTH domain